MLLELTLSGGRPSASCSHRGPTYPRRPDGFHERTDVIHAQPPVSAVLLELSKLSESRLLVRSPTPQLLLSPRHHLSRATPQPARNLEHDDQRGHVLPTLHLAHVRTLDIGEVGQ